MFYEIYGRSDCMLCLRPESKNWLALEINKIHKFDWLYVLIRRVLFFVSPLHHKKPGQHFNASFARQAFGAN